MTMTKPLGALFDDALDPENILFDTDSYKLSHYAQYPEGTEAVSSYIEARSPFGEIDRLVFFGLQVELARLSGPVVTQAALDQAVPVLRAHGFDIYVQGWQQIIDEFGGCLPIEIDALPEGTLVPVRIPQLRIRNTAPGFGWLVGLLETRLLRAVWYPTTVCVAIRTASRLKSSLCLGAISSLLHSEHCSLKTGTEVMQVHYLPSKPVLGISTTMLSNHYRRQKWRTKKSGVSKSREPVGQKDLAE